MTYLAFVRRVMLGANMTTISDAQLDRLTDIFMIGGPDIVSVGIAEMRRIA